VLCDEKDKAGEEQKVKLALRPNQMEENKD